MRPFRRMIKDYFLICDSYFQAIRSAAPSRIEAIDMGRRGLHDEGAEQAGRQPRRQDRDRSRDGAPPVHPDLRPAHPWLSSTEELPGSVLFACTHNAIRSPMAEALMKHLPRPSGLRAIRSASARARSIRSRSPSSTRSGSTSAAIAAKSFDDLEDDYFDLVISFSPEAHHRAVELTRTSSCEIEFWPTIDPSLIEGSREVRLEAYRSAARRDPGPPAGALPARGRPGDDVVGGSPRWIGRARP